MKATIYLIVDRNGVSGMRKSLPDVRRGEVPVKLNITVPPEAFAPPMLTQDVVVDDWRQGIDMADIEFKQSVITAEEAEQIRQRRLERMEEILKNQGYTVTKPDEVE